MKVSALPSANKFGQLRPLNPNRVEQPLRHSLIPDVIYRLFLTWIGGHIAREAQVIQAFHITFDMEDEFVDIVDTTPTTTSLQSPEKVEKKPDNNSTPPAPIRRSTRIRPQIPTYAQLRRRSTSPNTPPRKASKSNQKAKRGENGSAPKLKLRLGERSHLNTSFLGPWDRELDSDDEDLAFEEQFILRMPEDEDADQLRQMVAARDVKDDVWFKFTGESQLLRTYFFFPFKTHPRFASRHLSYE